MKRKMMFKLFLSLLLVGSAVVNADMIFPIVVNKKLKNVVMVAKAGGNFSDPVAALASIGDAAADNPYLVYIGPGVYELPSQLAMKPYVDVVGSGEGITRLEGAFAAAEQWQSAAAVVVGAASSTLSHLTVENSAGLDSTNQVGVYLESIFLDQNLFRMRNVTVEIPASLDGSTGIVNSNSYIDLKDVTVLMSGTGYSYGVYNNIVSGLMEDVTIKSSGATYAHGVYLNVSNPRIVGAKVHVEGNGGGYANAIVLEGTASPVIRASYFEADNAAVVLSENGSVNMASTTLMGSSLVMNSGAGRSCVACDNGEGTALNENCSLP